MRCFTYLAEQSFKTDAEGQRLFCLGGPLSRPFLVPDPATESRMFRKLSWFHRVFFTTGFVVLLLLLPRFLDRPTRFIVYLGAETALHWLVLKILFSADLRKLSRKPSRIPLRRFYAETGRRHSTRALMFGLIGSLAFVAAGTAMLPFGGSFAIVGVMLIIGLGLSAAAWGYALRLRAAQASDQDV
jgi:hypothetical protein